MKTEIGTPETIREALGFIEGRVSMIRTLVETMNDASTGRIGDERNALDQVAFLLMVTLDEFDLLESEINTAYKIDSKQRGIEVGD